MIIIGGNCSSDLNQLGNTNEQFSLPLTDKQLCGLSSSYPQGPASFGMMRGNDKVHNRASEAAPLIERLSGMYVISLSTTPMTSVAAR